MLERGEAVVSDRPGPVSRADRPGFRPDVQGIRALAVVLVVLDHARIGPFRGGYVGVDAFFVVSGFLITGLLLAEAERTGRVSLTSFWGRRARRILPAATLVAVVTVLASLALLSAVRADAVVHDVLWATFFAANVDMARQGTDYFHAGAAPSPVQHYWSLSVEEQFYVVWPVLVALLCLVLAARRRRNGRVVAGKAPGDVRRVATLVVVPLVAASWVWSAVVAGRDPVGGYFSTPARAWELGVGALLACLAPGLAHLPRVTLTLLGWSGLAGLLAAACVLDADTVMPGTAAAVPVVATAALLAAGLGGTRPGRLTVGRWLSVPPLQRLGDWSYSLYLWHWPVLVLAAAVWGRPSGWSVLPVLVVVVALAAATFHWVEDPARRARWLRPPRRSAVLLYPAGVLVTVPVLVGASAVVHGEVGGGGPAITTSSYGQAQGRPVLSLSTDPAVALVQASVEAAHNQVAIPAHLQPSVLDLAADVPDLGRCEYYRLPASDRPLCARGDTTGTRTLVVVGDSHARQWIPALDPLARAAGYRAFYLVREGCPAADVTPWKVGGGPNLDCQHFQNWARAEVASLHPDVVVLANDSNQRGYVDADGRHVADPDAMVEVFRAGLDREISTVGADAARVVVIGDPPALSLEPGDCLSERGATLLGCVSAPDPVSERFVAAEAEAARDRGADFVDTTPWFCWRDQCPSVVGRYITHRDRGHVSQSYAASLTAELGRHLRLDPAGAA